MSNKKSMPAPLKFRWNGELAGRLAEAAGPCQSQSGLPCDLCDHHHLTRPY